MAFFRVPYATLGLHRNFVWSLANFLTSPPTPISKASISTTVAYSCPLPPYGMIVASKASAQPPIDLEDAYESLSVRRAASVHLCNT